MDQRLGDNDSFRNFVAQCRQEGIKIIVNGVFNHTKRESFAFRDIQKERRGSSYKGWCEGVNFGWQNPCGDSFGYEVWQGHFELPYLNLFNPDIRSYPFDIIRFRTDEFDIDGIHLNCVSMLDSNFMKEVRSRTETTKKDFWLTGKVIHRGYSRWVNSGMLHPVTNYELHKNPYSGFNDHNFFEIAHNVERLEAIERQLYALADNHDEGRTATKLNLREHLFPIYPCLFTLPDIPSVYYGGGWGIEEKRASTSDEVLRPAISIDREGEFHCELTDPTAQLEQIHKRQETFHTDRYQGLLLISRQCTFARCDENSVIIAAVDNGDEPASLPIPVPIQASKAVSFLEPGDHFLISDGKIYIKLEGSWGAVLKPKGEN